MIGVVAQDCYTTHTRANTAPRHWLAQEKSFSCLSSLSLSTPRYFRARKSLRQVPGAYVNQKYLSLIGRGVVGGGEGLSFKTD